MKKNKDKNNTTGYIEGYYGKLLSWKNRKLIISSLQKNNMNTYFYAPKEGKEKLLTFTDTKNPDVKFQNVGLKADPEKRKTSEKKSCRQKN